MPLVASIGKDGFACRYHRAPADVEEVVYQGLYILQRALLGRRCGQAVVALVGALGHIVQALANDAQALADLLHPHYSPVIAVALVPSGTSNSN